MNHDWSDGGRRDKSSEHPANFDNGSVFHIWEAIGHVYDVYRARFGTLFVKVASTACNVTG